MKSLTRIVATVLSLGICVTSFNFTSKAAETPNETKNVIILIPDGMSVTDTTLARWYQGGSPLALDEMASGLVRTYWSAGAITDSAPAGTAMATGHKTTNKYIGVLPAKSTMPGTSSNDKDQKKPAATVLEAARLSGKSTGLIATSNIQHATPAAFSSHYYSRSRYDIIGEQQVYGNIDIILGSGYKYLMPENRSDKEDLLKAIPALGYDYVKNTSEMKASTSSKLWGFFADDAMAYDMDRDPNAQPSLSEMTDKAISVLSKNKSGFFLMVEGSKVDWAAHANDPIGVISDVLAFDKAVKVALDFAKKDGNTMVLALTDHGNGGISIGDNGTSGTYDNDPLEKFMAHLQKAKLTGEGLESKILSDKSNIVDVMKQYFGITDLTQDEIAAISSAKAGTLNSVVGPMISQRAHIGWTTTGHTGEDITLYSYLPGNTRITGVIDNTDIAKISANFLNVNLDKATEKLFVPARSAFEAKGAKVAFNASDIENPVIEVTKDGTILKLFINKNIAEVNGKTVQLSGVVIYNDDSTFVPADAVDIIK